MPREPNQRAPVGEALLLGVMTAGLLLALQPRVLWGPDAAALFQMVQQGTDAHWMHLLYVPMARAVGHLGGAVGLEPLRAIAAASALGVGAGVAISYGAATRLGASRRESAATAILAGTAPSVVFFGLLLEVQGVYFAFTALAWLATTRMITHPSIRSVGSLGLTTGLAAMAHSSGHILPVLLATFALTRIPRSELTVTRLGTWALVGAVAHAVPPLCIELLTGLPALENLHRSFGLASGAVVEGGVSVLDILWSDWLLAFAPIAITSWAALRSPEWRSSAAWLLAPLALYLLVAWRVLSTSWTIQATEHGAYLMPFAFPFAWLTVRGLGARHTPWIAAIAILVAVLTVRAELDAAPAAGDPLPVIAAVDDPRGVVVLADPATADAVLIEAPDMVTLRLDQLLQVPGSMLKNPGSFDQQFDTLSQSGRTVAFEQSVLAALELLDLPLASHLRREYHLERRTADGFTVVVVRPRE